MNGKSIVFFLLVIILLLGGVYYLVNSIQQTAQTTFDSAVAPFAQSNAALQTQVSQLMNPTPTIIVDPVTYIQEVRAWLASKPSNTAWKKSSPPKSVKATSTSCSATLSCSWRTASLLREST